MRIITSICVFLLLLVSVCEAETVTISCTRYDSSATESDRFGPGRGEYGGWIRMRYKFEFDDTSDRGVYAFESSPGRWAYFEARVFHSKQEVRLLSMENNPLGERDEHRISLSGPTVERTNSPELIFENCSLQKKKAKPLDSSAKEVSTDRIVHRDGLNYEVGTDTPFSGKALNHYDNGKLKLEMNFKDGKLDGVVQAWHENGQLKNDYCYSNGNRVDMSYCR